MVSSKTPSKSSKYPWVWKFSKLIFLYLDSRIKYWAFIGDKFSISISLFCIVPVAKSPKSIKGVFIDISGPITLARISTSNEIPSSNWKTTDALKRPNSSGINLILKGSSCPNVITNLSSIFTFSSGMTCSMFFSFEFILEVCDLFFIFDFFVLLRLSLTLLDCCLIDLFSSLLLIVFLSSFMFSLFSVCFLSTKLFLFVKISIKLTSL